MNRTNQLISSLKSTIETAEIHDIVQVTDDIFHVTANFNVSQEFTQPRNFRAAIAEALGRTAVPIEASFKRVQSKHKFAVAGYVSTHPQSIELNDEVLSSGRFVATASVGSNVMIDSQDESLWELSTAGDKKYLVRNGDEDLDDLVALATLQDRKIRASGSQVLSAAIMLPQFNRNDFISFVHPETATVHFGVVVGTVDTEYEDEDTGETEIVEDLEVVDFQNPEVSTVVSPYLVVTAASVSAEDLPQSKKVQANVETASTQELLNYFRDVFAYNPVYFARLEQQITEHTAL